MKKIFKNADILVYIFVIVGQLYLMINSIVVDEPISVLTFILVSITVIFSCINNIVLTVKSRNTNKTEAFTMNLNGSIEFDDEEEFNKVVDKIKEVISNTNIKQS